MAKKVKRNTFLSRIEQFVDDSISKNQPVTVREIAREFFGELHPVRAQQQAHANLHWIRKLNGRKIYPSYYGGPLVDLQGEVIERKVVQEVFIRQLDAVWASLKKRLEDIKDPRVVAKISIEVFKKLNEIGFEILKDIQNVQHQLATSKYKELERGFESAS